ncbi:chemotaxis protein CheW [Azoarcus olearius]|uniref:Chemotaxis protein CheW n=1 Tax=Azoarcus sp. (strain BH72) TaxID=418699 RepID=A1K5G4_AZOSB|nr:chemotaxis protein CheW [Azoarcus olearius]CAL94069.1 positive regulator of CheA protein activity [Azoarcus olearius]
MSAPDRPALAPAEAAAEAGEFLTFTLGGELYAIDILKVREIRAWERVTRIAGAPAFLKGVMNLRGAIVPVVDLRLYFGCGDGACGPFTVMIVLQLAGRLAAVVVDAVADVVRLAAGEIQPAPEFAGLVGGRYIRGLGAAGDAMLVVLDVERLMAAPELALVDPDPEAQS